MDLFLPSEGDKGRLYGPVRPVGQHNYLTQGLGFSLSHTCNRGHGENTRANN